MKKTLKGIVSNNVTVTAFFREDADGNVHAECPEIPGCVVTGCDERDAKRKIKAAVKGCLNKLLDDAKKRLGTKRTRTAGRI